MSDLLPDCMMPDGGSACIAYHEQCKELIKLKRERDDALQDKDKFVAEAWSNAEAVKHLERERDDALSKLAEFVLIARNSNGVDGFHLNGDIADWDDLLEKNEL